MAPVLILFILFGPISISLTYRDAVTQSNQNSLEMLRLAIENLELLLSDMDFLTVSLDSNASNASSIKTILRSPSSSYEILKSLEFIAGMIAIPENSRPFIQSIYIYVDNNYNRFLTSSTFISNLSSTYDSSWYNSYISADPSLRQWAEVRHVKTYARDKNPQQVVTIYRRLVSTPGVIVFNIKQSYFKNMMGQLTRFNEKNLLVLGPNGELLFSSLPALKLADLGVDPGKYPAGKPISVKVGGKSQLMTILKSDKFNWTYVSLIPADVLYAAPERLLVLLLVILFIALVAGLLLAYSLTSRSSRQIMNIIDVFQAAEEGKPLPPMVENTADGYSYILHNILKTFLQNDYLKMQFSLKQLELKNAELLALQSQLNPHFLFNTLETINLEILSMNGKPMNANKMIKQLALILEYAFHRPGGNVLLRQELENIKRYIELQTYRYGNRFNFRWNVDDAALDFQIPPLVLQPLIENSIHHGFREKDKRYGIKLSVYPGRDGLHIRITDNGIGIMPETLATIRYNLAHSEGNHGDHVGLYNTNKRLALSFGEQYCIYIKSRFGTGTYLHIFLPGTAKNEQKEI